IDLHKVVRLFALEVKDVADVEKIRGLSVLHAFDSIDRQAEFFWEAFGRDSHDGQLARQPACGDRLVVLDRGFVETRADSVLERHLRRNIEAIACFHRADEANLVAVLSKRGKRDETKCEKRADEHAPSFAENAPCASAESSP